jgi:hypothetical protein
MYALYAVTTKANRSSARLLKNNRKTFSSRGKRFFSVWKRGEVMKKKGAGSVGGKGIIFLNLSPGIQRFFRWKER